MSALPSPGVRTRHLAATATLPRVGTSLAVSAGTMVSLAPSLLPRSAPVQGVLTGVLVATLWGAAALIGRLRPNNRQGSTARLVALVAAGVAGAWAVACADRWQNSLRAAMALPSVGAAHWTQVGLWAAAVCLVSAGIARGLAAAACRLGPAGSTALAVTAAALTWFVAVPGATSAVAQHFRTTSAVVDPGLVASDGNSIVPWTTLGAEGRRFVAGASDPRSIRTYVGLDSAPDVHARAALAVRDLDRAGGFTRGHVVVAVPTGSGWIDGEAARGIERRFGGDVAIVGQQYSYAPSWVTFLFGRSDAQESARALFAAVSAHVAALPQEERPMVHVYGQSLGAVGGSAILDDAVTGTATCSALWAGPPAGAVHLGGATVLANSSDPVVWWSPALLTSAPDLTRARVDAPVPQWIPFVSFVQTTVDLVFSLDAPTGHGHRYGADQGLLPGC
ncbi:alpha/beta-hydrolase family protein [Prescottella agglutinans]|uniref:alpha/beta-hydrolase family protein n=1 Tax=Prescottella agglutinans TaxID=1644129 RepID=UPI003D97C311